MSCHEEGLKAIPEMLSTCSYGKKGTWAVSKTLLCWVKPLPCCLLLKCCKKPSPALKMGLGCPE